MVTPRCALGGSLLLLIALPTLCHGAAMGDLEEARELLHLLEKQVDSSKPALHEAEYVGIGYNILTGNPEGGNMQNGGVDPGLNTLRRVFAITYDEGKLTNDNEYKVPDEVAYLPRSSAVTSKETDTFFGAKSYAKKLSHQVAVDASVEAVFASFEFSASHKYEAINEEATTNGQVFFSEQSIQNFGEIRYLLAKGEPSEMFRYDVCSLPTSYNPGKYFQFLDDWGTHVVKQATLGVRSGTTFKEDKSSFVKDASTDNSNSVSAGGNYKIFSASLSVDVDRFSKSSSSGKEFGKEYNSFTVGSEEYNEPISVKLMGLNEALDSQYWSKQSEYEECGSFDRSAVQENIMRAFREYPEYKNLSPAEDPTIVIPLTWPEGKYALPDPVVLGGDNTCPKADYMNWNLGMFYQITEDGSECSKGNHLTNYCEWDKIRTYYCVKTIPKASGTSWTWTPGVYCIFKYGDTCPDGFGEGFIKWNDADKQSHPDYEYSTMPSGTWFNGDTQMDFCCREDGQINKPIFLPTESPFYLIKFHDSCQEVNGMSVSEEYIMWSTKAASPDRYQGGEYPLPGNTGREVKISYCFYQAISSARRELEEAIKELVDLLEDNNNNH